MPQQKLPRDAAMGGINPTDLYKLAIQLLREHGGDPDTATQMPGLTREQSLEASSLNKRNPKFGQDINLPKPTLRKPK